MYQFTWFLTIKPYVLMEYLPDLLKFLFPLTWQLFLCILRENGLPTLPTTNLFFSFQETASLTNRKNIVLCWTHFYDINKCFIWNDYEGKFLVKFCVSQSYICYSYIWIPGTTPTSGGLNPRFHEAQRLLSNILMTSSVMFFFKFQHYLPFQKS